MFFKKQKTKLEQMIDADGIDAVAEQLSILLNDKIPTDEIALQFVLEELDAARQGNTVAQHFVHESGFTEDKYTGAMSRSCEAVDGVNGPQQLLHAILVPHLQHDMDLMIAVRLQTLDHVMRNWYLGKYNTQRLDDEMDVYTFNLGSNVLSAPKGHSKLIAVLKIIEMVLNEQMWHVNKIDYGTNRSDGVLFAIVGQAYVKFNGPDRRIATTVEASECTKGIIENDLDVLPTVLMQLSFKFYKHDIKAELELFDSRANGGYSSINALSHLVNFSRDEFLGSFFQANPQSDLEKLFQEEVLFDSKLLLSQTFENGPMEVANNIAKIMNEVSNIIIRTTINL